MLTENTLLAADPGQDGLQVLDLRAQAVAGPVRAGLPAAPAGPADTR